MSPIVYVRSLSRGSQARVALLVAAALLALTGIVFAPVVDVPADAATGVAYSKTKKIERTEISADGTSTTVADYDIKVTVSQTTNLRGRQEVAVRWSGAHPTGGLVDDVHSGAGVDMEYPFVLLQCRGVENPGKGQTKVRPETCWTQTAQERFRRDTATRWPAWRSDAYATPAERERHVLAPDPRPDACGRVAPAERWVPFIAKSGTVYQGGPTPLGGCVGMAPESDEVGTGGLPSNTTYGITDAQGNGSASFPVWTSSENASLGCTDTVDCSLVAVPVVGISCDASGTRLPAAARPNETEAVEAAEFCDRDDAYAPGTDHSDAKVTNLATAGTLWWSASNWRNRFTVPLKFAASDSICKVVGGDKPEPVYGSVILNELTASWQPKFCTDRGLFPFVHVQSSEVASRNLLQIGNISAALGSQSLEAPARPTVQAPLAVGGFAVVFNVDGSDKEPKESLKLNGRLLAKLLSQSYPALDVVGTDYAALAGNPMNITVDPEFKELNPGVKTDSANATAGTIQFLGTDSDLMWSVTRYLDADPEARAWLNGTPDPWGMKVNPAYKDIELPTEAWPQLDTWIAPESFRNSDRNFCYSKNPSPVLGLVSNPTTNLASIAFNIQYALSAVNFACEAADRGDVTKLGLKKFGRQLVGSRMVLGLSTISAARRYNLRTAALKVPGGSFVAPDVAGLTAAAKFLQPDDAGSWSFDYAALKASGSTRAYPGLVPVFADVPTQGVDAEQAGKLSRLLCYAATSGQTSGASNGQLPAGYLPITAANGLGELRAYTVRASRLVKAQTGQLPGQTGPAGTCSTKAEKTPETAPSSTPNPGGSTGSGVSNVPVAADQATPGAPETGPVAAPVTEPVQLVRTKRDYSPLGNLGFLLALALLVAALIGGLGLQVLPRRTELIAQARAVVGGLRR
ncbi:hypothetical protein ABIE44_002663 [Marmoricola sp. OAE513]|uniref:hypothetical protein n=1 Tax=Marmoricola sp. OAE513 TaxID=2817894 RepID=UPI001AE1A114